MEDFEASYAAFRQRREKLLQRERDLRSPEVVRKDFTDSLIYRTNENALQPAPQQQIDPWADWNHWCDSRIYSALEEFGEDIGAHTGRMERRLDDAIKAERETVLMPAIAEALSTRICDLRKEFDEKLVKLRDELKGGT